MQTSKMTEYRLMIYCRERIRKVSKLQIVTSAEVWISVKLDSEMFAFFKS